jgi:hypothetical protein
MSQLSWASAKCSGCRYRSKRCLKSGVRVKCQSELKPALVLDSDLNYFLRNSAAVTSLDSLIYLIGGAGTKENIYGDIWTVETYNAISDKWIETSPLPIKNVFFGRATVGNKIYVIAGTVGGNPNWDSYPEV